MATSKQQPAGLHTDKEAWENRSDSRHAVLKTNRFGEPESELVGGRKIFYISPQDRVINMESAASAKQDPFRNGQFAPVRLLEDTEDASEIASNPNLIGESEMAKLIKGSQAKLEERLAEIDNHVVVTRMLELAKDQDATVKKVDAIATRADELKPTKTIKVNTVQ